MIKKLNFYQIRAIKMTEGKRTVMKTIKEMMKFIRQNRRSGAGTHGSTI